MMMSFFFFFFIFCIFSVLVNKGHFLNLLLVFELMVVTLFLMSSLSFMASSSTFGLYFCIIFLCFSVCESVLGLSILVSASRRAGLDYSKSFSFMGF